MDVSDPSSAGDAAGMPNDELKAAKAIQACQRGHLARKQNTKKQLIPADEPPEAKDCGPVKKEVKTVLGTFRNSLRQLFVTLDVTSARYIRCLKPNAAKSANLYIGKYVERQLSYNGVLAIVEIQAAGYAVSLIKREFVARYQSCCVLTTTESKALKTFFADAKAEADGPCKLLLLAAQRTLSGGKDVAASEAWLETGGACLGLTKVFVKEMVLRQLERAREATANASALLMQRHARRYLAKQGMKAMRRLTKLIQSVDDAAANTDAAAAFEDAKEALKTVERALAEAGLSSAVTANESVDLFMVKALNRLKGLIAAKEKAWALWVEQNRAKAAEAAAKKAAAEKAAAEKAAADEGGGKAGGGGEGGA